MEGTTRACVAHSWQRPRCGLGHSPPQGWAAAVLLHPVTLGSDKVLVAAVVLEEGDVLLQAHEEVARAPRISPHLHGARQHGLDVPGEVQEGSVEAAEAAHRLGLAAKDLYQPAEGLAAQA